jgi:lysophospholipase L1-like esterase
MQAKLIFIPCLVFCFEGFSEQSIELVPAKLCHQRNGLGNVFAKLKGGKDVSIAYFGGSITAQAGWRVKTLKWFQNRYPDVKVSEINAAIGGTGSGLGVYRFHQDVLQHKPDLIFVEFSVNDGGASPENIWRGMEGIIRQAWKTDPTIDICYVYTFRVNYEKDLDRGLCPRAASADEMLAEHYGIPSINMAMKTAEHARNGKLLYVPAKDENGKEKPTPKDVILFSRDGVHPLDGGHTVYTDVIADAMIAMEDSKPLKHEIKKPYIADNWERANLVPLSKDMMSGEWQKLGAKKGLGRRFRNRLPELWETTKPGSKLTFKFKGTKASLYDILGPDGGQVIISVDGKTNPKPRPRFDRYCRYHRLASLGVASKLTDKIHEVSVELHPDQPDRSSVVDKEKLKPNFNPGKYDGTGFRVGFLMLLGDLVNGD